MRAEERLQATRAAGVALVSTDAARGPIARAGQARPTATHGGLDHQHCPTAEFTDQDWFDETFYRF